MIPSSNTLLPWLIYNLLFYSIPALSLSITSTQNVCHFISSSTKKVDVDMFNELLVSSDVLFKIRMMQMVIKEKYGVVVDDVEVLDDYVVVSEKMVGVELSESVQLMVGMLLVTMQSLMDVINVIRCKIEVYNGCYVKCLYRLSLEGELGELRVLIGQFDKRVELFYNLLGA